MFAGRLQVLADGKKIHPGRTQIVHHLHDLLLSLAQADHQTGLGEHPRITLLDLIEQAQGVVIAGARPDAEVEPRHGFQVVVEHIRTRIDHHMRRVALTQEVWGQDFDRRLWRGGADGQDDIGEMLGAAVGQVVPIHRGDHDVPKSHLAHRVGDAAGFGGVQGLWQTGGDIAEGAGPGADLAHDHHGGVGLAPTLPDIRAGRLFAYGGEPVRLHDLAGFGVAGRARRAHAQPGGFAQHRRLRSVLFFRVPQGGGGAGVDHRGHAP